MDWPIGRDCVTIGAAPMRLAEDRLASYFASAQLSAVLFFSEDEWCSAVRLSGLDRYLGSLRSLRFSLAAEPAFLSSEAVFFMTNGATRPAAAPAAPL